MTAINGSLQGKEKGWNGLKGFVCLEGGENLRVVWAEFTALS